MSNINILCIEDNQDILELLKHTFKKEEWTCICATSAEEGFKLLEISHIDVILLDIMLPGLDGVEALRRIKRNTLWQNIPIIMASAKQEDTDIVSSLEMGADDYIVKPYSPKVLVARIRKMLRSKESTKSESTVSALEKLATDSNLKIIRHGPFSLNKERHEFKIDAETVNVSSNEFLLLELFLKNPGRVFSRTQIIDYIKGSDYPVTERAVDVQIVNLRRKLKTYDNHIETVRGVGYRMQD